MKKFLLLTISLLFVAMGSWAQNSYLNETFNTTPTLSISQTSGAWYVDRYAPAAFVSDNSLGVNALKISIDGTAGGAANRPNGQGGQFYNTQGRKFDQNGLNANVLKGSLYLPADWATKHRRSDMWATTFNASNNVASYPIIGFRNIDGATPSFSYWNETAGGWVSFATPSIYDVWYNFEIRLAGGNVEYYMNGNLVGTVNSNGSISIGNVIMQAYNFNDATLASAYYDGNSSTNSYDAYWDNIVCQSNIKNITQSTYYPTVQTAVIASIAGDVIEVAAGTYEFTSQMNVDKPGISINGLGNVIFQANNAAWSTTNGYKHLIGIYAGTVVNPVTISNITMNCNSQCYGLNTYNNANSVLNGVTINGSKGAGLTVNGSTVSATNLNTGTNAWGAVNVDPGSGVTTPSVFTLNSGTLAENTQIWSDGNNVTGPATVTVNATGYNKYNVGTTKIWTNRALANCATITNSGETTIYSTIQAAIDGATAGDVIDVYPGNYYETASNKPIFGVASYQFGLYIDKNNLTIRGVKADGSVITSYSDVATLITTNSIADFGPSGIFVQANNVTLQGLGIGDNIVNNVVSSNKTIEIVGDAFTMKKCVVNTSTDEGAFYMGRWDASHPIDSYSITDNLFNNTVVSINNGVGITGLNSGRLITGNTFTGVATPYLIGFRGWNGANPVQPWIVDPVGGAIVTGNTFNNTGVVNYIIARGNTGGYDNSQINWNEIWTSNLFGNHVVTLANQPSFDVRSYTDAAGYTETRRISPAIQENTTFAQPGDVVLVAPGTYTEQLHITTNNLTINGAGKASTTIKSPATLPLFFTTGSNSNKPVVFVDGVNTFTLKDVKVDGDHKGSANYRFDGIAFWNAGGTVNNADVVNVMDNAFSGAQHGVGVYAYNNTPSLNYTIALNNINVNNFQKNGIALNGSDGVSNLTVDLDHVTVVGMGNTPVTAQNGIQTSSANGTINDCSISQIAYSGANWTATALLVYGPGTITADHVDIDNSQTSVYWIDANGTYKNSAITNPLMDGIYGLSTSGTMNFTVDNVSLTGANVTDSWGINPLADGGTINMNIANCNVTNFDYGMYAYRYNTSGGIINTTAHHNSIVGNTHGFATNTSNLQDATCNWWGTTNAYTVASSVSGNVEFLPFSNVASPMNCLGVGPVTVSDPVASFMTIQAGINAANPGATVTVAAGTFNENVTVNKRITLNGAGATTFISSAAATTPVMTITASGANATDRLVISNLKVTGATGLENPGAGILVQSAIPTGYYTFSGVEASGNQGSGIA
ncbi:MAG: beta strand repeat-containing protein, partial [Bacteroidales bacterium]